MATCSRPTVPLLRRRSTGIDKVQELGLTILQLEAEGASEAVGDAVAELGRSVADEPRPPAFPLVAVAYVEEIKARIMRLAPHSFLGRALWAREDLMFIEALLVRLRRSELEPEEYARRRREELSIPEDVDEALEQLHAISRRWLEDD